LNLRDGVSRWVFNSVPVFFLSEWSVYRLVTPSGKTTNKTFLKLTVSESYTIVLRGDVFMNGQSNQPIFILPEGALREQGSVAQRMNIEAAKQVADSIRTTLGPKGMDKMLTNSIGDVIVTNDGVTILEEMDIQHPAAKMIVEVAKTQDEEVGDGTTTAAVLAGTLLKNAEPLLDQKIHPTTITKGYRVAKEQALKILDELAVKVKLTDTKLLNDLALTAMTGKSSESNKEFLAQIATAAVRQVSEKENGKVVVDLDRIKIEKAEGASIDDTTLISGLIIDKERVHSGMPTKVRNAKIALVNAPIEVRETETDAKISITDPSQLQAFIDQEENMLKDLVKKITDSGANVVFCQKGIDDLAQHYLAKAGILAARRVKKSDMEALEKATGGKIVTTLEDLSAKDFGKAGIVEEKKISGNAMIFVRECSDPKAVSILVRGGTEHVTAEIERAMNDAIGGVAAAVAHGSIVAGGGSTEAAIARQLRKYAEKVGGREQLAINAFADALDIIPKTLAENSGMDPIDVIVDLRAKHDSGKSTMGVDVFSGKAGDMLKKGVIEPKKIKEQAIKSASEAAEMILRIDDVITTIGKSEPQAGGMGGQMGGMPPGMM